MSVFTKAQMWRRILNGCVFLFPPRCGRSPIYRSREMAARALVPLVMVDQVPNTVRSLLATLPSCTDQCFRQNHIHGTLLQVSQVTPLYAFFISNMTAVLHCDSGRLFLALILVSSTTYYAILSMPADHFLTRRKL